MRNILFVAPECPWPAEIGLRNHSLGMLRALRSLGDVMVLGFSGSEDEDSAWRQLAAAEGFSIVGLVRRASGVRRLRNRIHCLRRGWPLSCADYEREGVAEALRRAVDDARLQRRAVDLIVFEMFWTLLAAPDDLPAPAVLFPVDAYSLYWRRMGQTAAGWTDRWRAAYLEAAFARLERSAYTRVDRIVTVAPADAAVLQAACPSTPVSVVPVPLTREFRPPAPRSGARRRVLVGGYFHTPSIAADTRRFLEALAPLHLPAEIVVWGRGAFRAGLGPAAERAGATIVEWVDDPAAFLASAQIYVYPQRFACGIQTKIQEALSAGLCVVAGEAVLTPVGATPGVDAVLAQSPEQAVDRLGELLSQPEAADCMGARARRLAEREFSLDAVTGRLRAALGWRTAEEVMSDDHLLHC